MGAHLIDGEFQSDKYPTCPRGKVPLSVKDPHAQDLLWDYAKRHREIDKEFSDDLELALIAAGFPVVVCQWCSSRHRVAVPDSTTQGCDCAAAVFQRDGSWWLQGFYGSTVADLYLFKFRKNEPKERASVVCDECIQARIEADDLELVDDNYLDTSTREAIAALNKS